jgi:AraC-like DNA-binding protein
MRKSAPRTTKTENTGSDTRKHKSEGFMRHVLARNLRALADHHFPDETNKPKKLATITGMSASQIQRILNAELGTSIDNMERLAAVFSLSVYQVTLPNLNVEHPQEIVGATKAEEVVYHRWQAQGQVVVKSDVPTFSPRAGGRGGVSGRPARVGLVAAGARGR